MDEMILLAGIILIIILTVLGLLVGFLFFLLSKK